MLQYPHAPWDDALCHGQMQSKAWAIRELSKLQRDLGLVYVVGGWLGTMGYLMCESSLKFRKIRSFDIDPSCQPVADQLNIEHIITGWRFKAVTMDMFAINYGKDHRYQIPLIDRKPATPVETCNTIINTCCDHINLLRWWTLIPAGKLVVLQNNDLKHVDHINRIQSLDDLLRQAPMSSVLVSDQLPFAHYTRFMVIGIK